LDSQGQNSRLRRAVFSLFLALVVCGMSFYVILFLSLSVIVLTHQANPATAPGLQAGLRHIVLPISAGLAVLAFVLSFWHLGRRDGVVARPANKSNKAAV
jgi:TRAP-type C4-dicarboxylate transport system permease small subunit